MLKDIRHGFRTLLQAKGWTAVVVLSLALGIGANTALFSTVNGMLLTQVPVKDPDSLVRLRYTGRHEMVTSSSDYGSVDRARYGNVNTRTTFSYALYKQFLVDNKTMTDLFACAPYGRLNVVVDGQAELANAFIASGNYFQLLGVGTRLGRPIQPDDDKPSAPPVAVISSKYWHSRFGTDPSVIGKTVKMNNVPITIVGVLAGGVHGDSAADRGTAGRHRAARAGTAAHDPSAEREDPHRAADLVLAADHGPPEAWRHARTGAGQPRGRLSEHRAGGHGCVPAGSERDGPRVIGQPQPDADGGAAGRAGEQGDLRREPERSAIGHDPQRGRRAGAADRLRQRSQPAALARDDASEGAVGPPVAGRDTRAPRAAVADREPAPRRD